MKISLIIPCIARHFRYIWRCLNTISSQTRKPDEVVISLAECDLVPKQYREALCREYSQQFSTFILLENPESAFSGPNRQKGSEASSGDILIYQDADDYSHRQRIEVLEHFFSTTDALHIAHPYKYTTDKTELSISIPDIQVFPANRLFKHFFPGGNIRECANVSIAYGGGVDFHGIGVAGGPVAIRREVLQRVNWKAPNELYLLGKTHTEDYEFDMEVLYTYKKSILIDAFIYYYNISNERLNLSGVFRE